MIPASTQPQPLTVRYSALSSITPERMQKLLNPDINLATEMGYWDQFKDLFRHEKKRTFLKEIHNLLHPAEYYKHARSFNHPAERRQEFLNQHPDKIYLYKGIDIGLEKRFHWIKCHLKPDIAERFTFVNTIHEQKVQFDGI